LHFHRNSASLAQSAAEWTWDRNAVGVWQLLQDAIKKKGGARPYKPALVLCGFSRLNGLAGRVECKTQGFLGNAGNKRRDDPT
jgi:hypothetical protein